MTTLLLTIVPSILILIFFIFSDKFREPKKIIIITFLFGVLITIPAGYLNDFILETFETDSKVNNALLSGFFAGGLVEETLKFLVLYFYILREKAKRVYIDDCVDTCGTGGDGLNTLNISTAAAILLASMGVKVAKHGNKAVSSKCGSGDVLEELKININFEPNDVEKQININNFGFMFAPNYHSAMKFVGPTRKKIGKRTIFNMIGPLSSPALVDRQVVGVFDKKLLKIFANALLNLNLKFAWIVNSEDGLDEISPYAKTDIVELANGKRPRAPR